MIKPFKILPTPFFLFVFFFLFRPSLLIAQTYTQVQIDSLQQCFKKSTDFEEKNSLLKTLSNFYEYKGDWEKYEKVVNKMLELQHEKVDSGYLAEIYNKLGISNSCMGKNKEAVSYFAKALEINLAMKKIEYASNSYENMAAAYKDMGKYKNATDCLLKSLEIRKKTKHPRIFNNYMKLAVIQQLLNNENQEEYYLQLARAEMQKNDSISPSNKAIFYNEIGNLYNDRGMYDSCLVCYKRVLDYSTQIGWNRGIAEGLGNLADTYNKLGLYDKSIEYHKKSLKLSEEISDCMGVSEENLYLAELYQKKNNKNLALFFSKAALQHSTECNLLKQQANSIKFIAEFYKTNRQFEKATDYLEQYYRLNDSISSTDVKNNIAELETKYEIKDKEQQIELLSAENEIKNQRIRLAVLFIGLLFVIVLFVLLLFYYRRKEAAFKQSELQQQLLLSQMNPHFIFNVMGSIQGYLYKNEASKAAEYLSRFGSLSRSVMEFSSKESITLKEEIEMLKNYIELQKASLEKPFEVEYTIDEEMETDFIKIPPMLLQPFVENAIKHGLNDLTYLGKLVLSIQENGEYITVKIDDNGKGLHENTNKGHKSRAIEIFQLRRKGIEHKFKKRLNFEIQNLNDLDKTKQGVLVIIQLPILNYD